MRFLRIWLHELRGICVVIAALLGTAGTALTALAVIGTRFGMGWGSLAALVVCILAMSLAMAVEEMRFPMRHHPEACEWFIVFKGTLPKGVMRSAFAKAKRNKSGSSCGRYKGVKWMVVPTFTRTCPGYIKARELRRKRAAK